VNLIKKLTTLLAATGQGGDVSSHWLAVRCDRCGETVRARVSMSNDLSTEYDENGKVTGYFCRKVLIGPQRCFQPIEVTLKFDAKRKLVERTIAGGKFVE
jgi:hypothetical protein